MRMLPEGRVDRSKPLLGRDQASHLGKCASADAGRVLHVRCVVGEAAQHQGGGVGKGDAGCIKDEHAICGLLGTCVACLSCWAHMPLTLGDMPYRFMWRTQAVRFDHVKGCVQWPSWHIEGTCKDRHMLPLENQAMTWIGV